MLRRPDRPPAPVEAVARESFLRPPVVRLAYDPRVVPPRDAVGWRRQFAGTVGPGPTSTVAVTLTIPQHLRAVVREFVVDINNLLSTSDVSWSLQVNGGEVPGWTYRQFPFASPHVTVSLLSMQDQWPIEIPGNAVVSVLVTVGDANTYSIGVNIAGWLFSTGYDEYPA